MRGFVEATPSPPLTKLFASHSKRVPEFSEIYSSPSLLYCAASTKFAPEKHPCKDNCKVIRVMKLLTFIICYIKNITMFILIKILLYSSAYPLDISVVYRNSYSARPINTTLHKKECKFQLLACVTTPILCWLHKEYTSLYVLSFLRCSMIIKKNEKAPGMKINLKVFTKTILSLQEGLVSVTFYKLWREYGFKELLQISQYMSRP